MQVTRLFLYIYICVSVRDFFPTCSTNESVLRTPCSVSILRKYAALRNEYPTNTRSAPPPIKKYDFQVSGSPKCGIISSKIPIVKTRDSLDISRVYPTQSLGQNVKNSVDDYDKFSLLVVRVFGKIGNELLSISSHDFLMKLGYFSCNNNIF